MCLIYYFLHKRSYQTFQNLNKVKNILLLMGYVLSAYSKIEDISIDLYINFINFHFEYNKLFIVLQYSAIHFLFYSTIDIIFCSKYFKGASKLRKSARRACMSTTFLHIVTYILRGEGDIL